MKSEGVTIIGLGAQTAVGSTALASAAAVRAGVPRLGEHRTALDAEGEPLVVGMASYLPEEMPIHERLATLARAAAREAMLPIAREARSVAIIVGLPVPRAGLPPELERTMAAALDWPGGPGLSSLETIEAGHSAGLMAIERARALLCDGALDLCLAGGVDSYLDAETLYWLSETGQAQSRSNRWGFRPGEGAGFCLLASSRFVAEQPRLHALGELAAVATSREQNLIRTDSVCTGEGLTAAWRMVTAAAPRISELICDLNAEPYRADELGFALLRLRERFERPEEVLSPAQHWGDVGAASGPLFVCLALASALRGVARGRHCLVSTSSEGGERSAALLDLEPALSRGQKGDMSRWP